MTLIGWWKLDGDARDSSMFGNHGTVSGGAFENTGKTGRCFASTHSGYIAVSNSDSLNRAFGQNRFSFAAWVYSVQYADYQGIINKRSSLYYSASTGGLFIDNDGNTLRFVIGTGNDAEPYDSITYAIPHDRWVHVAATAGGSTMMLYIDGTLVGSAPITKTPPVLTSDMSIGSFYGASRRFNGKLCDVRVYNHALSLKEIVELAKAKIAHYTCNLLQEPTDNKVVTDGWYTTGTKDPSDLPIQCPVKPVISSKIAAVDWGDLVRIEPNRMLANGKSYTVSAYVYVKGAFGRFNCQVADSLNSNHPISVIPGTQAAELTASGWYYLQWRYTNTSGADMTVNNIRIENYSSAYWENGDHETWGCNYQIEWDREYCTEFVNGVRAGTLYDSSGFDRHVSLPLATTPRWISDSKIGTGCYQFNGSNTVITLSHPGVTYPEVTVSCWFKLNALGITQCIFQDPTPSPDGNSYGYPTIMVAADNRLSATGGYFNSTYAYIYGSTLQADRWYHLVAVIDSVNNSLKLYLDGVLDVSGGSNGVDPVTLNGSQIGARPMKTNAPIHFDGYIDDIRFYSTLLSDDAIGELYRTRASVDDTGNMYVGVVDEPREHVIIQDTTMYVSDNTYNVIAGVTPNDRDLRDFVESDKRLGNAVLDAWIYCSSATYYPTRFELTKENNDKGIILFIDDVGYLKNRDAWGIGWHHIQVPMQPTGYVNEAITPWENMTRLELYRSGPATGTDPTQYIRFRDCKLVKHLDNVPIKPRVTDRGLIQAVDIDEIGVTRGLVGYWKLDGDARDYSGNGNHGTVTGAVVKPGLRDRMCYQFDGADDVINCGDDSVMHIGEGPFTVILWAKATYEARNGLFSKGGCSFTNTAGIAIESASSPQMFYGLVGNGTTHIEMSYGLSTFDWTQIGLMRDDEGRIFKIINGVVTQSGTLTGNVDHVNNFVIGGRGDGTSGFLDGSVADVRFYNRSLAADEIGTLYKLRAPDVTTRMQFNIANDVTVYGRVVEGP